jgi:epoxide hydrolase-like protein
LNYRDRGHASSSDHIRRECHDQKVLIASLQLVAATAAAFGLAVIAAWGIPAAAADDTAIHPFHYHASESSLADLRKRIANTRWSDKETVSDRSQGNQLATLQEIVHYWGTDYNWRKVESRLNALPMFTTKIDGVDIQFIQVKSHSPNALPIIITHGWPGSIIELLNVIDPLTNPTAHGGRAEDAFDVVIPSMPGYGFSGKPTGTGWDPDHIARAWGELMKRLGYTRYVAQGGDWGSPITEAMARQLPAGLVGIHVAGDNTARNRRGTRQRRSTARRTFR